MDENGNFPQLPIIDIGSSRLFSATKAAEWIGITSRRVRQLSKENGIGHTDHKNRWTFTLENVKFLDNLHKLARGKSRMRDVTPKDPAEIARLMNAEDGILRFVEGKLRDLRRDTFDLITEVGKGYWNMTVKELDRKEKLIAELRGELNDLKRKLTKEDKEDGRGRLLIGVAAPLTPYVEADGAAA